MGDFHAMMAFIAVICRLISGNGFEEVLLQAGHCMEALLVSPEGSNITDAGFVHEAFPEALQRLFSMIFTKYYRSCSGVCKSASRLDECEGYSLSADESVVAYIHSYKTLKERCLNGDFGKTPKFWMICMDLVDCQRMLYFATDSNTFNLRLFMSYVEENFTTLLRDQQSTLCSLGYLLTEVARMLTVCSNLLCKTTLNIS